MQGDSEKSGRSVDVAQERGGKRGHGAGRTQERSKVKIFGKEIHLVLPLMEYASTEILVLGAVAVSGIGRTGGETRIAPVLDVIRLDGVCLISVSDFGVDVGEAGQRPGHLLDVIRPRIAEIHRGAEIHDEHLLAGEILLQVERQRRGVALVAIALGEQNVVGAVAQ